MEQSSSCHLDMRASILSPTRNNDAAGELTELLAKSKAEYKDKATLLADAEGLIHQQAPPGPSPALITIAISPYSEITGSYWSER